MKDYLKKSKIALNHSGKCSGKWLFYLFFGGDNYLWDNTAATTREIDPNQSKYMSVSIFILYLYSSWIWVSLKIWQPLPEWQLWLGTSCGQFGVSYFQTSPYRLEVPWFLASYFKTVRSWGRQLRPSFGPWRPWGPWGFLWSLTAGSRPFTQSFQGLTPGAFEGPPDDGFLVLRQLQHRHDRLPGRWLKLAVKTSTKGKP